MWNLLKLHSAQQLYNELAAIYTSGLQSQKPLTCQDVAQFATARIVV